MTVTVNGEGIDVVVTVTGAGTDVVVTVEVKLTV